VPDRLPLIYVDSCVYLDIITRNEQPHKDTGDPRYKSAHDLFSAIQKDYAQLAASALTEAEVLCNGQTIRRNSRSEGVRDRLRTWFESQKTVWIEVDRFLVREAVRIKSEFGYLHAGEKAFKSADALHLAAAQRARCQFFMTHDEGFPIGQVIDGLQITRPKIVWQETLLDHIEG
jgi:predicted nucleic acid-binding protein